MSTVSTLKVHDTCIEEENKLLKEQVKALQKFIAEKWFIDVGKVQEYVEDYLSKGEYESVKLIQDRIHTHDWVLDELNKMETCMMQEFKRMEDYFRYGKEEKAEEV